MAEELSVAEETEVTEETAEPETEEAEATEEPETEVAEAEKETVAEVPVESETPEAAVLTADAASVAISTPAVNEAATPEVVSIAYERAIPYIAWLESDFQYDDDSGEYTCYTWNPSLFNGDKLTANYEDQSSKVYIYDMDSGAFVNEADAADTISSSDLYINMTDAHYGWKPDGDANYYTVSYQGVSCQVPIEIRSSPVVSIDYQPLDRYYFADVGYYYSSMTGDQVVVTYKDGSEETFVFDSSKEYVYDPAYGLSNDTSGCFVSQTDGRSIPTYHPYDGFAEMSVDYDGDTKTLTLTYMGVKDSCDDMSYYAKDISFEQSQPVIFEEGTDSETRTDENGDEYAYYPFEYYDAFQNGDLLTVTYENKNGIVKEAEYVYSEENYGFYMAGGRDANNSISPNDLKVVYPDQDITPLQPGDYSVKVYWQEDDGQVLETADTPYQIEIRSSGTDEPDEPEDPDEPAIIESFRLGETREHAMGFAWNAAEAANYDWTESRIKVAYDGSTICNQYRYGNDHSETWVNMYELLSDLDPDGAGDYPLTVTLSLLNNVNETVANASLDITLTVVSVDQGEPEIHIPETLRMDLIGSISKSLGGYDQWNWKVNGSEIYAEKFWKDKGEVTSVTSASTTVLAVTGNDYEFELTPKKTGSATITVNYTADGKAGKKTGTVKVVDRYLMITDKQDNIINYYSVAAGSTTKWNLQAKLFVYDAAKGEYILNSDVTDQTKFTINNIEYNYSGNVIYNPSYINASINKNVITVTPGTDAPEGEMYVSYTASYGGYTETSNVLASVFNEGTLILLNKDFMYPLFGKSAVLNPSVVKYSGGRQTAAAFTNYSLQSKGLEIKDKDGTVLAASCSVRPSQLPLTITNNSADSYFGCGLIMAIPIWPG